MSSSPAVEPSSPSTTPSSPALRSDTVQFHTSTPNYIGRKHHNQPLNVILPATAPATPPNYTDPTITPPPRSPGTAVATPASGDGNSHPPDGTSSDKSSETAVSSVRPTSTALSRKESYKAQRQHYRREKKRAASALLHSIEDPSVVVLADWLKVRGSLKSWTKLWCVLKPGLLLLYKTPKAKSSHWVGTVLLTSCQVIERPSKKDGFCFKLYHPLEQSIWAPRGPHNETIGAVVQPLPTAHLIFRAPSQAAGHCWLDGLELALRCSNAMLRCSRSRPEQTVAAQAPATQTNLSHEELEKHFNEHGLKSDPSSCSSPLMSISDYSPRRIALDRKDTSYDRKITSYDRKDTSFDRKYTSYDRKDTLFDRKDASYHRKDTLFDRKDTSYDRKVASLDRNVTSKPKRTSKWSQFIESIEMMRDHDSSESESDSKYNKKEGFLDFLLKRDGQGTSSMKNTPEPRLPKKTSKSLASSPMRVDLKRTPILRCFELPKLKEKAMSPTLFEDNLIKFMSQFPKRRSSTPSTKILTQKRISDLRESGVKTDSENDDVFLKTKLPKRPRLVEGSEVIYDTPENIIITKTVPSVERFRNYTSSSAYDVDMDYSRSPTYPLRAPIPDKYSLINYEKLPSKAFEASNSERRDERLTSQNVYVAGKIVRTELAGAVSDTDSDASRGAMIPHRTMPKEDVRARIEANYVEDPDREVGAAGELVEEVGEENKSLLWFLLKQVRPGMDLSKVVLPTFILEPRSFLDKLADSYYHADILAQTQNQEDPYQRFKSVLRWYLSGLYKKPKGLKKPYNPVLGEIFRCRWKHRDQDCYTYYVAEQVSHHPPISAFYVSNRMEGYVIEGSLLARSKFYGNSTSAILQGCARVHLLQWGETYVTTAPYAHCKGLVIGTLSMELGGKVQIMCEDTGYNAEIEFKLRSFLGGADQTNSISGRIKKGKDLIATLEGYWDGKIDIKDKKSGEESSLLDVAILKEQRLARYLMKIDRQQEFESQKLWIKVSEAIANDDQVAATEQKTIIEEAQRSRARNQVTPWIPRYFHKDLNTNPPEGVVDQGWKYNHLNTSPWRSEEVLEFEDDFVIQSLGSAPSPLAPLPAAPRVSRHSDSDTHTDTHHRKSSTTTRTLKHTLYSIESTLRDQALAIERLNKNVEAITETQRAIRPQNIGRLPQATHSWDLFGGFVLALVLQALLNWLFYHKD